MESTRYCGRFAPSPTGPLHFGSLVAAVASYLEARRRGGRWLVRIEDVDQPRAVAGAAADILRTLERYALRWDGAVMYQSQRTEAYAAALEQLRDAKQVYPCACSRREIADSALSGGEGLIYPGTCRHGMPAGKAPRAWRVNVHDAHIKFSDRVQGEVHSALAQEVGDFVVHRADGFYAYQLAVVVDDAEQSVSEVVRGADLLGSTPRQIYLQQLLDLPTPTYAHVPIAVNAHGAKLAKQTGAAPISQMHPGRALHDVLEFLGQAPPSELRDADLSALWQWALMHWDLARVPKVETLVVNV